MKFKKYQHVERFGTAEVEGIELGRCFIFPKLDGTNSSVWIGDDGEIKAGSRNRELTLEKDNAGFYEWVLQQDNLKQFFKDHPDLRLYGEWLVPHSLKTYREDAWRRFYVFDVVREDESIHLHYDHYKIFMDEYEIDYIPPIKIVSNASYDDFVYQLRNNVFMLEDGKGAGEGIVIKEYNFVNKYGRQVWAKIVTSEFKEKNHKEMGAPETIKKDLVEKEIADKFVTKALCEKVLAKVTLHNDGFTSRQIPQLLNTVFYDVVKEESWNIVKKFKNPTINYRKLQHFIFNKVKENIPNYF